MASIKKAYPSSANGRPITPPAWRMKVGQSSPNSMLSAVPETAPITKSTAIAFDQVRARASHGPFGSRSDFHSTPTISTGSAIPSTLKTMWKIKLKPIWARAKSSSSMVHLLPAGWQGGISGACS